MDDLLKQADSRKKILEAALKEFGEHGYDGASTNQICQAAGISKGLLYHYFKSKENLFLAVYTKCVRDMELQTMFTYGSDVQVDLEMLLRHYRAQAAFFSSHPYHYHILSHILGNPCESVAAFVAEKRNDYRSGAGVALRLFLSRKSIRAGVDKELAVELLLELVEGFQKRYVNAVYHQRASLDMALELMERELRAALDIVMNGILDKEAE